MLVIVITNIQLCWKSVLIHVIICKGFQIFKGMSVKCSENRYTTGALCLLLRKLCSSTIEYLCILDVIISFIYQIIWKVSGWFFSILETKKKKKISQNWTGLKIISSSSFGNTFSVMSFLLNISCEYVGFYGLLRHILLLALVKLPILIIIRWHLRVVKQRQNKFTVCWWM